MKKIILLLLGWTPLIAQNQPVQLSPDAEISVITCGPWQGELYSAFGHSAIRVYDSANRIDDAYNYGVFDFSQPNFYLNYTKGLLMFKLGVYSYPDFQGYYVYFNRSVTEQVLNLTPLQKQRAYEYLEWNALPENETYRYDYFYNNCATKIRDVFTEILKDSLRYDGSFITSGYTIRDLTDIYLRYQPWGDLGIDICLGMPMDKKMAPGEYMFIPDYVESSFDHASIIQNGVNQPLVKEKRNRFVARPEVETFSWYHPWIVFGTFLALTVALSIYDLRRLKVSKWFDFVLFFSAGLIGILLLFLWFATDHRAAANNLNVLWALPTHVVVVALIRQKSEPFLKKYFRIVTIFIAILLLSWYFLPQKLNIFLVPLVAAMGCRSFVLMHLLKTRKLAEY